MLSIKIPDSKRKKALILVDLQPIFLNNKNSYVLKNMENLLKNEEYFMYIEECVQSSEGEEIHEAGLKVLRHVNLTNNSCIEKIGFKEI
jgi:hypothetical protein